MSRKFNTVQPNWRGWISTNFFKKSPIISI